MEGIYGSNLFMMVMGSLSYLLEHDGEGVKKNSEVFQLCYKSTH
jgi:hypothetical protein